MAISCISDVHADRPDGAAFELLMDFVSHEKVLKSSAVAFLGDVFDHLNGEHEGYLEKYEAFFERVAELLINGKNIYFLEGNHDFHFEKTFRSFLVKKAGLEAAARFFYKRGPFRLDVGDKTALLCHGDEMDLGNKAYARWKRIYTSKAFGFFISNILPYRFVESFGGKASENSRQRGAGNFDFEREKKKYRQAAETFLKGKGVELMVSGHTHIIDDFSTENGSYHNIGFPLRDKSFVFLSAGGVERVSF